MAEKDRYSAVSRRKLLKGVGAGSVVALAGCTSDSSGNSSSSGNSANSSGSGGGSNNSTNSTGSGNSSSGNSYKIGVSVKSQSDPFMETLLATTKWYIEDNGHTAMTANAEADAAQQNQQVRNMLNSGIDGLLISPSSSDAAVSAVENATKEDVPVFAFNSTANSKDIKLFTSFGNDAAAYQAGQAFGKRLKQSGGSRIFEIKGDPADQAATLRSEGFHRAVKEFDGIKIVGSAQTDWSQQKATEVTRSYLQKDSNIDAIYGDGGTLILGPLQALKQIGMRKKRSEDGHVLVGGLDGFPEVLTKIQAGYADLAIDQPNPFYGGLSICYMLKYLKTPDESVLPSTGSTLKGSDVKFDGKKHKGVNPWTAPPSSYWAPAHVQPYKFKGKKLHPQLKTQQLTITKENVGKDYLWGQLATKITG